MYKGLLLLKHLIFNGDEEIVNCCRMKRDHLQDLEIYQKNENDLVSTVIQIHFISSLLSLNINPFSP